MTLTTSALRPTPCLRFSHKLAPSSRAWLARQFRDPYVKARMQWPVNYRSRSAFKLVELDARWHFLEHADVRTVVDLGAAPGGWSQVVAGKMGWPDSDRDHWLTRERAGQGQGKGAVDAVAGRGVGFGLNTEKKAQMAKRKKDGRAADWSSVPPEGAEGREDADFTKLLEEEEEAIPLRRIGRGSIVAVDLLRVESMPGVRTLQMDFLSPQADGCISELLREPSVSVVTAALEGDKGVDESMLERGDGKADVILSDMAANFTGNTTADVESSMAICESVFEFACRHLRTAESIGRKGGGALVLKHFAHPAADSFRNKVLVPNFNKVAFTKPPSSRSESPEGYWVCMGWRGAPASRR
ncbi:S-adenosyl-L-methionine-dependent methyltransferase [Ganoderma leucocontextum]|nr:S-adenosyl-L-methionine-dependent methyltransferase [Ganoderma leucocontextum]